MPYEHYLELSITALFRIPNIQKDRPTKDAKGMLPDYDAQDKQILGILQLFSKHLLPTKTQWH